MANKIKQGQVFRFDNTTTRYRIIREAHHPETVFWAMRLTNNAWQPIHIKVKALSTDKPENATYRVTNVDNGKSVEKKGIVFLTTTNADKRAYVDIIRRYTAMKPLKSWSSRDIKQGRRVKRVVGATIDHNAIRNMNYGKHQNFDPEFKRIVGMNKHISNTIGRRPKEMVGAVTNYDYLNNMTGLPKRR